MDHSSVINALVRMGCRVSYSRLPHADLHIMVAGNETDDFDGMWRDLFGAKRLHCRPAQFREDSSLLRAEQCPTLSMQDRICSGTRTMLGWIWSKGTIRVLPHKLSTLAIALLPTTMKGL